MNSPGEAVRRALHLDCFSGVSGNMVLGALLELGVPVGVIDAGLATLGIPDLRTQASKVKRGAIAACYVSFSSSQKEPLEWTFRSICSLLNQAPLSQGVRDKALRVFTRLAEAEARIHGVGVDEVHFHEVGAADTLGDVVGVCLALEHLEVGPVSASPVPLGSGIVETMHGRLPLPAPAALELLGGIPTYPAEVSWETVTPTGAALLSALVDHFGPMPPLTPTAQGFGAGDDRVGTLPNVLRGVLGTTTPLMEGDVVAVLETNLDDMNPEHLPYLLEELMGDGALDASLSPLSMKKGRPGHLLRVIARPADRDRLARRILIESSAIGVRYQDMPRLKLVRESRRVTTRFGEIPVKQVRTPDGRVVVTPEYEACACAAREHGVPLQEVYQDAVLAAQRQLP